MKLKLAVKAFSLCLMLLLSLFLPINLPTAEAVDLAKTQVFSSEKIEVINSNDLVNVYMEVFRPNSDIWLTIDFPDGVVPRVASGQTKELNINGHLIQVRIQNGIFLSEDLQPILTIADALGKTILKIHPAPIDLPQVNFEGNVAEMKKLNYLLTPSLSNGSFTMAVESGRIKYFERFSNFVLAFRDISDSPEMRLPSGTAKYAYLEKIELNRPNYTPGIWRLLDSDFEAVGKISSFSVFNQRVYPEGHGITTSPIGTPVVMSYVARKIDSSWLDKPYDAPILDCVFSQLSNGKAIRSFSVWDWLNSNRAITKAILATGDRTVDFTRTDKAIDFCHANSLVYSKSLKSYVVSLRNLNLVLIIDSALRNVVGLMYSPGSGQHFARVLNPNQITALGNYTAGANSKFQTWTKTGTSWNLSELNLPIKMPYCGNAEVLSSNHIWVAGGCWNFEKETAGILYSSAKLPVSEIGRFKLLNSVGSYRVDLYKP